MWKNQGSWNSFHAKLIPNSSIYAEEAWGATDFRHVLAELMPDLTIYFCVEESGCEIYATNDAEGKYFSDRYYAESYVDDTFGHEFFSEEEDAMNYVAELTGREKMNKEELAKWNNEQEDDDVFIYVHEFELIA